MKKGNNKAIYINFVLDETGSMAVCRDATISGFNEYIDSLKKQKNTRFTLTKFDSTKIDTVHNSVAIKDVPHLTTDTYIPGQMTPLYDAIAHTIKETEGRIKKGDKILCVIMTDGEENASKQYDRSKIFHLIKGKEEHGWTFVYLGANQDAWAVGQAIGLHKGNIRTYDTKKTGDTYRSLAGATQCYMASGEEKTAAFFDDAGVKEDDLT